MHSIFHLKTNCINIILKISSIILIGLVLSFLGNNLFAKSAQQLTHSHSAKFSSAHKTVVILTEYSCLCDDDDDVSESNQENHTTNYFNKFKFSFKENTTANISLTNIFVFNVLPFLHSCSTLGVFLIWFVFGNATQIKIIY